jgi:hypothetical protein
MNEGEDHNSGSRNNQMAAEFSQNVCLTEVITGPEEGDEEINMDHAMKRNNSTL